MHLLYGAEWPQCAAIYLLKPRLSSGLGLIPEADSDSGLLKHLRVPVGIEIFGSLLGGSSLGLRLDGLAVFLGVQSHGVVESV